MDQPITISGLTFDVRDDPELENMTFIPYLTFGVYITDNDDMERTPE